MKQITSNEAVIMIEAIAKIEGRTPEDVVMELITTKHTIDEVYNQVITQKDLINDMEEII